MRRFALILPLLAAAPLHAETLSAEIGRTGLAAVEARLSAETNLTDEDRFTLGGVQVLRAVEISFQERWREGLTDRTGMLPFLRLPIEDNPTPAAIQPPTIAGIFTKAEAELVKAKANLIAIPETSDFGATIALSDLWFDVNGNGQREPAEDLLQIFGNTFATPDSNIAMDGSFSFRFDVADAAWLAAYADMLSAICDVVLAYDPTEPITKVLSARAEMNKLGPASPDFFMGEPKIPDTVDVVAMILASLNQMPHKDAMTAAQGHLLAMVDENRAFWARVDRETDDQQEWLPNTTQHSALGIEVPPEAGPQWLAVLDEFEAILKGDKLIPFWRVGPPAGINLAKIFADPQPIDLVGWIQGWAVLPYLQQGPLASSATLDAFDQTVAGRSMLFALYFN